MWRQMLSADIRSDPDWQHGEYTSEPRSLRAALELLFIVGSSPRQLQRAAPTRDSADAYVARWLDGRLAEADANDLLYQVEASEDYDPSPDLERITVPVLVINPPELGLMERLIRRVPQGRFVLIPISDTTRGHSTHTVAAAWKAYFAPFVASLERAQPAARPGAR
jgi:homoserine O-acetyltransferase